MIRVTATIVDSDRNRSEATFGPFGDRSNAEACALILAGRGDVQGATVHDDDAPGGQ